VKVVPSGEIMPCAEALSRPPRELKRVPRVRVEIALALFGTKDTVTVQLINVNCAVTGFLKLPAILTITVPPIVVPASAAEHEIKLAAAIIGKSFIVFPPKFHIKDMFLAVSKQLS
jgi:hypothetical protein